MADQIAVSAKADEVKKELEQWAEERGVLGPGERLVFILRVESLPKVVHNVATDCWQMSPMEFFSRDRLMAVGASKATASRIHTIARFHTSGFQWELGDNYPTMQAFLARKRNEEDLIDMQHCGPLRVRYMVAALRAAGLIDW